MTNNPLLNRWDTPFGIPPFEKIAPSHFRPAIEEGISETLHRIDAIAKSGSSPDFENTIAELETAGSELDRIVSLLFNLNNAETSKELQEAAMDVSPLLTRFSNDITMNRELFERVKAVFEKMDEYCISTEQKRLTRDKYRMFLAGGATLDEKGREEFRRISEEISLLSLTFEENLLAETNDFILNVTEESELAGLPEGVTEAAADVAKGMGLDGWVFTLHAPSYIPFMQNSDIRELRKKMFMAYSRRGYNNNSRDNRETVKKIVNLRLRMAKLLGYPNYASFALEERMASDPGKVYSFLERLMAASRPFALSDHSKVSRFAEASGLQGNIERWDWPYYSEKLKRSSLELDDEILRPYLLLESAREAIFRLATDLYGISFSHVGDAPAYHEEVNTWEVRDCDGRHLAILMTDFHPRSGKSGGAWMTSFREQSGKGVDEVRPIVSIVTNFSRPTPTKPSLLTHSELTTFLHEFGHALHGMLSKCTYESLSGTNVARDFVELPSQVMENWAFEKDWLDSWAAHYITGEKIPTLLFDRIRESLTFNEGFACNRQLSFGYLDMAYHTLSAPLEGGIEEVEKEALAGTELFDPVEGINISCSFGHLFSGGYAAGYYGYKWAEVLDADAFSLFRERGLTDRETANSFRSNILEKGGTDDPSLLYHNFRGKEPSIEPLLARSGFLKEL